MTDQLTIIQPSEILAPDTDLVLPALIAVSGDRAANRYLEFFTARIRNRNTRRAYGRAAAEFLAWCEQKGVPSVAAIQPTHVSTWIEAQTKAHEAPTAKQRLAALRHLFDWLVTGHVIEINPAHAVRGPAHSTKSGRTPVLDPKEARALLDKIDVTTEIGLRDRALIALMIYSFARIGAALAMKVEDVCVQNRRLWVRLIEKGGKLHAMPCHHNREAYLTAYLEQNRHRQRQQRAVVSDDRQDQEDDADPPAPSQCACDGSQRAEAAGIKTMIGNHTFRATGITAYLKNGGTLEQAAHMANHSSTRTTQLYDRRRDEVNLDEVEKIGV